MKKTPSKTSNGSDLTKLQKSPSPASTLQRRNTTTDVNGKKASPSPKPEKKETSMKDKLSKFFHKKDKPSEKGGEDKQPSDNPGDTKDGISSSAPAITEPPKETSRGLSSRPTADKKPRAKSKSPPLSKSTSNTRSRSATISASSGTPLNSRGKSPSTSTSGKRESLRETSTTKDSPKTTTTPITKKATSEGNGTIGRSANKSPPSKTSPKVSTARPTTTSNKEKEKKFATLNGPMIAKMETEKKASELFDGKQSLSRTNSVVRRKEVKATPKLEDIFKFQPNQSPGTPSSPSSSTNEEQKRVASPNILSQPSKGEIVKDTNTKSTVPKKQTSSVTLSTLPAEVKSKIIKILGLKEKRTLRLANKSFKQIMDQYLGLVVKVSELDLNEASLITKVKYLTMDHPNLFGIDLTDWTICSLISKEILIHLPRELLYLNMAGCRNIDTLENLPPNLTHLNVSNCFKLTDEELKHLPPNVQHLNLGGCFKITDNVVNYLPATVVHLDLRGCYKLSDKFVTKLPPNIRSLNLGSCYKITDVALKSLPPTLKFIDLSKCAKVTAEAVQVLSQSITIKKED